MARVRGRRLLMVYVQPSLGSAVVVIVFGLGGGVLVWPVQRRSGQIVGSRGTRVARSPSSMVQLVAWCGTKVGFGNVANVNTPEFGMCHRAPCKMYQMSFFEQLWPADGLNVNRVGSSLHHGGHVVCCTSAVDTWHIHHPHWSRPPSASSSLGLRRLLAGQREWHRELHATSGNAAELVCPCALASRLRNHS
jgi:hypothetical protein